MDVDIPPPSPSMLSSSIQKLPKLVLSPIELKAFNEMMAEESAHNFWHLRIVTLEKTESKSGWRALFLNIFEILTLLLHNTDLKDRIIDPTNISVVNQIVKGFNEEVLQEWKLGAKKGVAGDWSELIAHRMYISHWNCLDG